MRRIAVLAVTALLAGSVAQAQVRGDLQGYVTDEQGGVLPGATVTVTNTETGFTREVVTGADGYYNAKLLPSGVYSITAALSGMAPSSRAGVRLLVGQVLSIDFSLSVGAVTEEVTVTAETPLVEVARTSAAHYVGEEEIDNLPITGRNYVDFALLSPTVKTEPVRGGISLSGQKGISSGLNIDGTEAKSAFFGYGRAGEATENDGVVIAQDTVKEFQVVSSSFDVEFGAHGGGYINVVTKSGTNDFQGSAFGFFRDNSMATDRALTPLDEARGNTPDLSADEFERLNWGVSLGGPIVKDKTHFFAAVDQTSRDTPFTSNIRGAGVYDAMLVRAPGLVDGFTRNSDGTASGSFIEKVDNLVMFGKIDHRINDQHTVSVRYNYTDFEITSDNKSSESLKTQKTHSGVFSLVSIFGSNVVNELRFQYSKDDLQRNANLDPGDVQGLIRISTSSGTISVGKPDFLPITVNEKKYQFQDTLRVQAGNHDLKFGFDIQKDDLSEFFAGSADGRYDYRSVDDFLNDVTRRVRIWFGPVSEPNAIVPQTTAGIFAQDTWRPNRKLTLNFGVRWQGTYNKQDIPAFFEEARNIPNDLNNIAPRFGFTYSPDEEGKSVIRGGVGLFHQRTPTLVHVDMVQSNGLCPPNCGRVTVSPGDIGFVPLGEPIQNELAPEGVTAAVGFLPADFQDPQTWRANLGYERALATDWAVNLDFVYAHTDNLQGNYDLNTFEPTLNGEGRYIYPDGRPDTRFAQIKSVADIGWSNYVAGTLGIRKRMSDGFQVQAHYTWSRDKDTDSNERSATGLTITNGFDPGYDYGLSERDITHRFVLSGVAELPLDIQVSGILTAQSGTPYTGIRAGFGDAYSNHPGFDVTARAVINGQVVERNTFRNPAFKNFDLRLSKFFRVGDVRIDLIAEGFNLFNITNFGIGSGTFVGPGGIYQNRDGSLNDEFGIEDRRFGIPRQFQVGARISF